MKRKSFLFIIFAGLLAGLVFASITLTSAFYVFVPSAETIRGCMTTKMLEVELCPTSKNYVPLKRVSKYVQAAIISSEDGLFYQHEGFDWASLKKSYEENKEAGKFKRGGSTITQQLAKNMFLTPEKSITRKIREAIITWKIEKTLSKKEILEKYLNIIEFGQGIHGIQRASQHYFQKSPSEIDVSEAAFLAMLLPSPKKYASSFRKKDLTPFAKGRISSIVNNLYRSGQISALEYENSLRKLEDFFGIRPIPADEMVDYESLYEGEYDEGTVDTGVSTEDTSSPPTFAEPPSLEATAESNAESFSEPYPDSAPEGAEEILPSEDSSVTTPEDSL